jgi:translocator protein
MKIDANPWILPATIAALAATFTAIMGGTMTDLGPWYYSLKQPDWAPPDYAFGIIWTVVFSCCALSGVSAWRHAPDRRTAETMIGMFAFNGFLNILWSFLFFKLHRPDWAQIEVIALWLSIFVLILTVRRYSKAAALLLLPYLLWVSVAGLLSAQVVQLNGPFG